MMGKLSLVIHNVLFKQVIAYVNDAQIVSVAWTSTETKRFSSPELKQELKQI